jgi:hypothetical protein
MKRALVLLLLVCPAAPASAFAAAKAPVPFASFHLRTLHLTQPTERRTASCSAHTRTGARVAKLTRKVLPVACEQPPRSWLGLDLKKQSAAIASILGP